MNVYLQEAGPWGIVAVFVTAVVFRKLVPGSYLDDFKSLVELLKTARDEEHAARVKAEKQRDELMAQYAKTTVQVISAIPVPDGGGHPVGIAPRSSDPGGDPDEAVAA